MPPYYFAARLLCDYTSSKYLAPAVLQGWYTIVPPSFDFRPHLGSLGLGHLACKGRMCKSLTCLRWCRRRTLLSRSVVDFWCTWRPSYSMPGQRTGCQTHFDGLNFQVGCGACLRAWTCCESGGRVCLAARCCRSDLKETSCCAGRCSDLLISYPDPKPSLAAVCTAEVFMHPLWRWHK
eukprot:s10047_g2.t1